MSNELPRSVPAHLEAHLGLILQGWSDKESDSKVKVVCFQDQPAEGIITYSTLGLSDYELSLPSGRRIRQEVLISADAKFPGGQIAGFLLSFAEHLVRRGRALLRGEVVGPERPIIKGVAINAVYSTNPTPFVDSFAEFDLVEPPVIFVLLVPINSGEAELVARNGWNWFEDALEAQDPDIWDLARQQFVVEED